MCLDPVTGAMLFAGASAGVAAAGDFSEGLAIQQANEFTADTREREARRTTELGAIEEEKQRRRSRIDLSQQVADLAAAGRDATTGTALALALESAEQAELDALSIRTNAILKSDNLRTEAGLLRAQGASARTRGGFSAAARILSGGQKILALQ